MYIKAFKINEVNINVKLLLTKSEAIKVSKKGNHNVRKVLLQHIAGQLMTIPDVSDMVGDDHIKYPDPFPPIQPPTEENLDEQPNI